jgi:hypothetical protein
VVIDHRRQGVTQTKRTHCHDHLPWADRATISVSKRHHAILFAGHVNWVLGTTDIERQSREVLGDPLCFAEEIYLGTQLVGRVLHLFVLPNAFLVEEQVQGDMIVCSSSALYQWCSVTFHLQCTVPVQCFICSRVHSSVSFLALPQTSRQL